VLDEHPEVSRRLREAILSRIAVPARNDTAVVDSLPAEYVEQQRAIGYVD